MENRLYKVIDSRGKESPPIEEEHLFDLVRRGFILPAALICDLTDARWFKAEDHSALKVIYRQAGNQIPSPPQTNQRGPFWKVNPSLIVACLAFSLFAFVIVKMWAKKVDDRNREENREYLFIYSRREKKAWAIPTDSMDLRQNR